MSVPPDETNAAQEFEALLKYLKQNRGFDFTGYKRSSLQRRVGKRLQFLRLEHYADYVDYLEVHPEEFVKLFNTILINVTAFFRDAPAWEFLSAEVIPALLAEKKPHDLIRIWSAGCSSGEEAYTLTIVFAEAWDLKTSASASKSMLRTQMRKRWRKHDRPVTATKTSSRFLPSCATSTLRKPGAALSFVLTCVGQSFLVVTT